jgi:hypothetical protein
MNEIEKSQPVGALSTEVLNELYGDDACTPLTGLSFNVIKVIRETAQYDLGADRFVKSFKANVLFFHSANQWWKVPFDKRVEGESPVPNCYSIDGFRPCGGDGMQADLCGNCPLNEFGTGKDDRGKACRNTVRMLLVRDGSYLPEILIFPPTSIGKVSSLSKWKSGIYSEMAESLSKKGLKVNRDAQGNPLVPMWPAVVEFSLEKKKFPSGEASIVLMKTTGILTPDTPENLEKCQTVAVMVKAARKTYDAEREQYITRESDNEPLVETDSFETSNEIPI